jgi:nucleoside-diphosphate kinase
MERTFIILKPDCMAKRKVGEIISRFEDHGYEIVAAKMAKLTPALLRVHYAHVADKLFYPEIEAFMTERAVLLLVIKAKNVVSRVRALTGPTNPEDAAKDTIRGAYGSDLRRNVIHASDTPENAELEIARFFTVAEIFDSEQ